MIIHKVKQGECLASIAELHGFAWSTIYEHPDNAEIRKQTDGNPNVLEPGMEIVIPDLQTKEVAISTGKKHRFWLKKPSTVIRLNLRDLKNQPLADKRWYFSLGSESFEGTLDKQGHLEIAVENNQEKQGTLKVWIDEQNDQPIEWTVIGYLDPIHTTTGIQSRLRNLCYYEGAIDGDFNSQTREALQHFQTDSGLPPTGEADSKTLDQLKTSHCS